MADPFEVGVRRRAVGDHYDDWIDEQTQGTLLAEQTASPLDDEEARKIHTRLMGWLFNERAKQADNRLQMAMDADFYDGEQWDSDDADALRERRQIPLVFNEVAPMGSSAPSVARASTGRCCRALRMMSRRPTPRQKY